MRGRGWLQRLDRKTNAASSAGMVAKLALQDTTGQCQCALCKMEMGGAQVSKDSKSAHFRDQRWLRSPRRVRNLSGEKEVRISSTGGPRTRCVEESLEAYPEVASAKLLQRDQGLIMQFA